MEEGGSIAKFMSPKLPLYETVKQLMKVKNFMKRGKGIDSLSVTCWAHKRQEAILASIAHTPTLVLRTSQ